MKTAECIYEPRGNNGLEGFSLGEQYPFAVTKYSNNRGDFYRIYLNPNYYETCGPIVFKRYFKILEI